ncbi:transporter substrate-binding domain-containing protein [Pseudomaricurvus alkylphenolicus]|uniref:substrate-binding periplasmic protein n=1 Tax=Pseudomaricurvus alkylphenolicus TaxID=1306991 RepID=UPI00141FF564|nr:transporter substrate-binding domain-containing protein [Pseudomaricurvus alkylphenolicus]NIB42561.1 transporter substrate-binding domain-containing protein [Pseudomaricurvus alkylphenolicus]
MIKAVNGQIVAILFWSLTTVAWGAAEPSKPIAMVSDVWCPFTCSPRSSRPGYITEVAKQILEPQGYRTSYRALPWVRAIREVKDGQADILLGSSRDEFPGGVYPPEPVGLVYDSFVVKADDPWRYSGVESLLSRRLGVPKGYDIGLLNRYLAAHPENGLVYIIDGENVSKRGLMMLNAGRIDTYLDVAEVVTYTARKMRHSEGFRFAGKVQNQMNIYLVVSPTRNDSAQLAELLARGIRNLRETGGLKEILSRYGMADWKPPQ